MHKHEWAAAKIDNGSKSKSAQKLSDGATCAGCKLVAKAPSKHAEKWLGSLPK